MQRNMTSPRLATGVRQSPPDHKCTRLRAHTAVFALSYSVQGLAQGTQVVKQTDMYLYRSATVCITNQPERWQSGRTTWASTRRVSGSSPALVGKGACSKPKTQNRKLITRPPVFFGVCVHMHTSVRGLSVGHPCPVPRPEGRGVPPRGRYTDKVMTSTRQPVVESPLPNCFGHVKVFIVQCTCNLN